MSTQSQRDANRRNALQSTGPKTPEGKAAASRNALKHGLLARDAVLPGEDPNAFLQLQASLEDDLQPVGALEELLVQQIGTSHWRLARLSRIETGMLESSMNLMLLRAGKPHEGRAPDEQHHFETVLLGDGLVKSSLGTDFCNLVRYENSIRRSFFKALTELRETQKLRPSQPACSTGIPACVDSPSPEIGFVPSPSSEPAQPVRQVVNLRPIGNRPSAPIPPPTPDQVVPDPPTDHGSRTTYQVPTPSPQTPNPEIGFVSSPPVPDASTPVKETSDAPN